jgi:hypothetical protein
MYRGEAQLTAGRQKQAGSKQGHSTRRTQAPTRGEPRREGKGERSLPEQERRGEERKQGGSQLEWHPKLEQDQGDPCSSCEEMAAKCQDKGIWEPR